MALASLTLNLWTFLEFNSHLVINLTFGHFLVLKILNTHKCFSLRMLSLIYLRSKWLNSNQINWLTLQHLWMTLHNYCVIVNSQDSWIFKYKYQQPLHNVGDTSVAPPLLARLLCIGRNNCAAQPQSSLQHLHTVVTVVTIVTNDITMVYHFIVIHLLLFSICIKWVMEILKTQWNF